jgi:hypothetical protein
VTILFIGPGGDAPANRLREVGQRVRQAVPVSSAQPVVELWDAAADRPKVDAQLNDGAHVMYFGHGYEDALGDPALVDAKNVGHASARIVLAMCCSSASQLGEDAISQYLVRSYLGFTRPIFVPLFEESWSFAPWCVAGTRLAEGATSGTAQEAMRQALHDEGDRILRNEIPSYESAVNDSLVHYGMALTFVCLGDRDASL